jgi:hypothetical protein
MVNAPRRVEVPKKITQTPSVVKRVRVVQNRKDNSPNKCDRTTSKMKGLSPKIISGDSRRSENAQTHTK